jgi:hypothetical protein
MNEEKLIRELWVLVGDRSYSAVNKLTNSYPTSPAFRSREDAETWKRRMTASKYGEQSLSWLGPCPIHVRDEPETPRQLLIKKVVKAIEGLERVGGPAGVIETLQTVLATLEGCSCFEDSNRPR